MDSSFDCSILDAEKGIYPEGWKHFINSRTSAAVYHLPEWSQVLEDSFGYIPFHIFAHNSDGRLVGVLPLFRVKSMITGDRLVSLPFSYVCGPVAESNQVMNALLEKAQSLCRK